LSEINIAVKIVFVYLEKIEYLKKAALYLKEKEEKEAKRV
jgi:hypothetical protein